MTGPEPSTAAPRSLSPRGRKLLTFVLGALFVACFVAFLLGVVVRKDLLDPELYVQALAENAVYERIYTEVLADPAMQDLFKQQLGIDLDLVVEELYAQVVAAGALVLPPSTLQEATEKTIRAVVGYVSGDLPELDASVRPGRALDRAVLSRRIVAALETAASARLAADGAVAPKDPAALDEAALGAYMRGLADGQVEAPPASVRTASVAGLSDARRQRLADVLLAPAAATVDRPARLQVEASLASDDLPSAVAAASLRVLQPRVEKAVDGLLGRLAASGAVDGLALAAANLRSTRAELVDGLNAVRGYAELLRWAVVLLALAMMLLMAAIVWLNGHELRAAMASAGWTLVAACSAALGLWLVAGWWLKSLVGARLAAVNGLPPGLEHVVDDVLGSLSRAVFGSIWGLTLFWLVVGLAALAFAYSSRLATWLRQLLAPVWPYRVWVLAGIFGLIVVVPLFGRVVTARQRAANPSCNGHPELCDRPVNEVVFASSHNAMSITEYGWLWPMHDGTVTDQLEAGVRALLVDTHYVDDEESEKAFLDQMTPAEREVAAKAIASFQPGGLTGALLCHESCGLGATDFGKMLDEVRGFLDEHPREVLALVIQDEITAEDTGAAVTAHRLEPYIYTHPEGQPWPTLREMIDSNKRLIIMAENEGPPPDWYTNAWGVTEETPYTFVFKESFSCEPNRGETGKPFFLLNHWIQRIAPNRADAAVVNDYDFLLARAQQCAAERGKTPNFVAVNFYGQGDLFRVVDTLNGVGQADIAP
jgi:hypothetical protein